MITIGEMILNQLTTEEQFVENHAIITLNLNGVPVAEGCAITNTSFMHDNLHNVRIGLIEEFTGVTIEERW